MWAVILSLSANNTKINSRRDRTLKRKKVWTNLKILSIWKAQHTTERTKVWHSWPANSFTDSRCTPTPQLYWTRRCTNSKWNVEEFTMLSTSCKVCLWWQSKRRISTNGRDCPWRCKLFAKCKRPSRTAWRTVREDVKEIGAARTNLWRVYPGCSYECSSKGNLLDSRRLGSSWGDKGNKVERLKLDDFMTLSTFSSVLGSSKKLKLVKIWEENLFINGKDVKDLKRLLEKKEETFSLKKITWIVKNQNYNPLE